MIANAKQWAVARNLSRKNEVHGELEYRVPTESGFDFTSTRRREAEGGGTMEVSDPSGSLLNFGDLSADQAIMCLAWFSDRIPKMQSENLYTHIYTHVPVPLRRGASNSAGAQILAQSAAAAKVQNLPMIQQNQDPFCS